MVFCSPSAASVLFRSSNKMQAAALRSSSKRILNWNNLTRGSTGSRHAAATSRSSPFSTLVLSEPLTADNVTPPQTQSAITAAQQLSDDGTISLLVVGPEAPNQIPAGVTKVLHAATSSSDTSNHHPTPETIANAIKDAVSATADYTYIVGTSTKFGSTGTFPYVYDVEGLCLFWTLISLIDAGDTVGPVWCWYVAS